MTAPENRPPSTGSHTEPPAAPQTQPPAETPTQSQPAAGTSAASQFPVASPAQDQLPDAALVRGEVSAASPVSVGERVPGASPVLADVRLPVAPPAFIPGQPYPPFPYGYAPPRPTNGMAIASMVLGILWLYWIGSVLALIFGYVARQQIMREGHGGDGMAVAGIVLGWVGVAVLSLLVFSGILVAADGASVTGP